VLSCTVIGTAKWSGTYTFTGQTPRSASLADRTPEGRLGREWKGGRPNSRGGSPSLSLDPWHRRRQPVRSADRCPSKSRSAVFAGISATSGRGRLHLGTSVLQLP
jgi:hypothetical protein